MTELQGALSAEEHVSASGEHCTFPAERGVTVTPDHTSTVIEFSKDKMENSSMGCKSNMIVNMMFINTGISNLFLMEIPL